jgi:hypothetical protein
MGRAVVVCRCFPRLARLGGVVERMARAEVVETDRRISYFWDIEVYKPREFGVAEDKLRREITRGVKAS